MDRKIISKMLLSLIMVTFISLIGLLIWFASLSNVTTDVIDNYSNTQNIILEEPTYESILIKHDCEYIKNKKNDLYVKFPMDLYNENGNNNKSFFDKLIEELIPFFKNESFSLIDEEKDINITIEFDTESEQHKIFINGLDNYFTKIDGKSYSKVDNSKIVNGMNIYFVDTYLDYLNVYNKYFSSIEDKLGEGIDIGNNYKSYLDGKIKIRVAANNAVKNIVFCKGYENEIARGIKVGTPLKEIAEKYEHVAYGSVKDGFLAYRQQEFYIFFYEDEISLHTYGYVKNTEFEELLSEYLSTNDLDTFVTRLTSKWLNYDKYEYNPETKSAKILYASRGIEIDIEGNNPGGVTLYNNYCFSDLTKKYVKNGLINFKYDEDLIYKTEQERRNEM